MITFIRNLFLAAFAFTMTLSLAPSAADGDLLRHSRLAALFLVFYVVGEALWLCRDGDKSE